MCGGQGKHAPSARNNVVATKPLTAQKQKWDERLVSVTVRDEHIGGQSLSMHTMSVTVRMSTLMPVLASAHHVSHHVRDEHIERQSPPVHTMSVTVRDEHIEGQFPSVHPESVTVKDEHIERQSPPMHPQKDPEHWSRRRKCELNPTDVATARRKLVHRRNPRGRGSGTWQDQGASLHTRKSKQAPSSNDTAQVCNGEMPHVSGKILDKRQSGGSSRKGAAQIGTGVGRN